MNEPLLLAFGLTLLAGAATTLGGLVAVHRSVRSDQGLAVALGFAGGAMVLVSLVEIVPKGVASLSPTVGGAGAWVWTLALAALGAATAWSLGRLVTGTGDHDHPGTDRRSQVLRGVRRSGLVVAVTVAAHNFPEGLVTFVTALENPVAGATLAVAIALHNVPEGIAVAAPTYGAGGSRRRALTMATLSGLAEPVGALLGYLLLVALLPPSAFGVVFGFVAGVMLFIGLAELLPSACRLRSLAPALTSSAAGGATMALSLLLLRA